jgi:E3 SUMO-protein ligase PIAS1
MSFKNLPKSYTLSIQLIRCISLDSLVNYILKQQSQLTNIHNSNDSDIEIEDIGLMTTRQRVSLICPITQSLIVIPVKSSYCSHLTCFDLRTFLQMNQKRLQWTCPICKKSASYETLHVDKRLQSILLNIPNNCSTVEIDTSTKILSDCQYILDNVKHEKTDIAIANASDQNDEESIHDSPNSKLKIKQKRTNFSSVNF